MVWLLYRFQMKMSKSVLDQNEDIEAKLEDIFHYIPPEISLRIVLH